MDQPTDLQPAPDSADVDEFDTLFAADLMEMVFDTMRLHTNDDPDRQANRRKAAVAAVAAMAVALPLAGAAWVPDGGTLGSWVGTLPGLALVLLPAAFAEEFAFRGVALVLLSRAFGRGVAVVTLALFFAAAHVLNPEVTRLGILNVGLAGVFLGAVFYMPGGIWTAMAAHFAWNFALATLAAPVSGLPFLLPGIDYLPGSPRWLSGGTFGPEGGLIATVFLTLATLVAARFTERPKESYA